MDKALQKAVLEHKTLVMGIVNATPDSFSDGGEHNDTDRAVMHGLKLLEQGAHILDIGGESTRPGAKAVPVEVELERVVPVIKGLKEVAPFISIDTRNAKTMSASIEAGANIINDVSGLTHDADALCVAADSGLPVCIMHAQGVPETMQDNPQYDAVVNEVQRFFFERIEVCLDRGIKQSNIILDPGIGFGKSLDHNLSLIKHINVFKEMRCMVLLGASRKSFIGAIMNEDDPKRRLGGSVSSALYGAMHGADIVRVHDVWDTVQALDVMHAIHEAL